MYHELKKPKGLSGYHNMPKKPNFTFAVSIRIPEAFTLDSIVRNPRTFKPKDVHSACQNNEIVVKSGNPPQIVTDLATYVMTDFFAMAHATGLYNRQRTMWESLSQVNGIQVYQQSVGLFQKQQLDIFDFHFVDYKGKPLIIANLMAQAADKKSPLDRLKSFISHCHGKPTLTGIIACYAAPFPAQLIDYIQKQTNPDDPIRRYESVLPGLKAPIDLIELSKTDQSACGTLDHNATSEPEPISSDAENKPQSQTIFQLVHPDLKKGKSPIAMPIIRKKTRPQNEQAATALIEVSEEAGSP